MTFGPIANIWTVDLEPEFGGISRTQEIPGATALFYNVGAEAPSFVLNGQIATSTIAASKLKAQQLAELIENIAGYPIHYIQFAGNESIYDGWYSTDGLLRFKRTRELYPVYPFSVNLRRRGVLSTWRPSQYWKAEDEVTTGFTSPSAITMISLPYNATDVDVSIAATRTTSDSASNQILENPTRETITFTPSATLTDWTKAQARAWDSVTPNDSTESNWSQIYGKQHVFAGDLIFENGLLRYKIYNGAGTFYVYDTVTNPNAWVSIGALKTALTGNHDASIKRVTILSLTPDEIVWRETRHYGTSPIHLTFTLRRGAQHCRVKLETHSLGIDTTSYVQLYKAGGYLQLFNAGANGAAGAGDLAQQASTIYECGYKTTANVVGGFAVFDQPTKQPYDPGAAGDYLPVSLTWAVGTTRTFSVIGWAQDTSAFNLTTGRANAASNAAYSLRSVKQCLDLVQDEYYAPIP